MDKNSTLTLEEDFEQGCKEQGATFKEQREKWGIRVDELARFIGVSSTTIRRFEAGGTCRMWSVLERGLSNYTKYLKKVRLNDALIPLATGAPRPDDIAICCTACSGFSVCDHQVCYVSKNCQKLDKFEPEVQSIMKQQERYMDDSNY